MSSSTEVTLNPVGNYANGVASDIVAVIATQPLDTLKTDILSGRSTLKSSLLNMLSGKERPPISRLWNGTMANCSGAVVQGGLPFLVNGALVDYIGQGKALPDWERVALAISTGVATSTLIAPLERWAKMHQIFGGTNMEAFQRASEKGSGGLLKAVGPVALRDAMVSGAFFGGRKVVEHQLEELIPEKVLRESLASVMMGVIVGALSTPADKINVLMQGDRTNEYPSVVKTMKTIIRREGVGGLYRGAGIRSLFVGAYMLVMGFAEKNIRSHMPSFFQKQ